ncbi:Protein of unknown function [Cotesia congregata]|uniref:Uncharacterized protein n=1 Tax=Cotesia congregata TaxID=51543 RepID=A0A8J2EHG9_COTCN|nr:Protein of unknown function [Cotesia congregata]
MYCGEPSRGVIGTVTLGGTYGEFSTCMGSATGGWGIIIGLIVNFGIGCGSEITTVGITAFDDVGVLGVLGGHPPISLVFLGIRDNGGLKQER